MIRRLHDRLIAQFPPYAAWHEHPLHPHIHWCAVAMASFFGALAVFFLLRTFPTFDVAFAAAGQSADQIRYRWREDDGSEIAATARAAENTSGSIPKSTTERLRVAVSNEGSATTDAAAYRLQYAYRGSGNTACASLTEDAWVPVPTAGAATTQHWTLADSTNVTHGAATTNIASLLTDDNSSFQAGTIQETTNETGATTLTTSEFTELEYPMQATTNATTNGNYCMRLIDANQTPVRTGAVALPSRFFTGAALDLANGFAYFGTQSSPGVVVKVRLSDFTHIATLTLNTGEDNIRGMAIDGASGMLYATARVSPGIVVKVRLSDFTRVGAVTLNSGENSLNGGVLDATNGFYYAFASASPSIVIKIRVSDMTRIGALTLNTGENTATAASIDGTSSFLYIGTLTSPGIVVKIQLSDFTRLTALTLSSGENSLRSLAMDSTSSFLYAGTGTSAARIVKIQLSDFSRVGALTLSSGENTAATAVIDATDSFLYIGTSTTPGRIVKVRLSDFTRIGALTLNSDEDSPFAAVIDSASDVTYSANFVGGGRVVKVRLSDLTRVGTLSFDGYGTTVSATIDAINGFAYFGSDDEPASISKIRLSDFALVGTLTLSEGESGVQTATIDPTNGFAYFGTNSSPGIIVKIRLSDFTRVGALTLNTGENILRSAAIDVSGGFVYFGTETSPGIVVKVRLSDLTRVGAVTLASGENKLKATMVIDTTGGFLYVGTQTTPGVVAKIQLSDFTRVGTLTLASGENDINSATIDPANGFAYFGTLTTPGRVVKVRLSDFTRVGALTLASGEDSLRSGEIDAVNGFAYFCADVSPARLIKIRLSDFTRIGALTLNTGENRCRGDTMVFNPVDGFVYHAGDSSAFAVKIDLRNRLDAYTQYALASVNTAPTGTTPSSISQSTDGLGRLTFSTTIADTDSNETKVKVEYSDNGGTTWYDPDLVSVTPSQGATDLDDAQTYQIGTVNGIDTDTASTTLTIVWDTKSTSNGNGAITNRQTDILVRVTPNDGTVDGPVQTSAAFTVDNAAPTGLGSFVTGAATTTTQPLTWTAVTEDSFDHYELWIGTNATEVGNRTITATEWDASDDVALGIRTTTATTITGLAANTEYALKIWAVDALGNEATVATITGHTAAPANVAVLTTPPPTPPANFRFTDLDRSGHTLIWDNPPRPQFSRLVLYRSAPDRPLTASDVSEIFIATRESARIATTVDDAGKAFRYRLKAALSADGAEVSSFTPEITVIIPPVTTIPSLDSAPRSDPPPADHVVTPAAPIPVAFDLRRPLLLESAAGAVPAPEFSVPLGSTVTVADTGTTSANRRPPIRRPTNISATLRINERATTVRILARVTPVVTLTDATRSATVALTTGTMTLRYNIRQVGLLLGSDARRRLAVLRTSGTGDAGTLLDDATNDPVTGTFTITNPTQGSYAVVLVTAESP